VRTGDEIADIFDRRFDMVYRICYSYLKNPSEAEDASQDTFMRLIDYSPVFSDSEHEKAWLIRVAINICKNILKHPSRSKDSIDDHLELRSHDMEPDDTLAHVLNLPEKLKIPVYMHYYEGYTSVEIAKILGKPESTIRNLLSDARKALKIQLEQR